MFLTMFWILFVKMNSYLSYFIFNWDFNLCSKTKQYCFQLVTIACNFSQLVLNHYLQKMSFLLKCNFYQTFLKLVLNYVNISYLKLYNHLRCPKFTPLCTFENKQTSFRVGYMTENGIFQNILNSCFFTIQVNTSFYQDFNLYIIKVKT